MSEKRNCDSCALGLPVGGLSVCTIRAKGRRVKKLTDVCDKWQHWSSMMTRTTQRAKPIKRKKSTAPRKLDSAGKRFNPTFTPPRKTVWVNR